MPVSRPGAAAATAARTSGPRRSSTRVDSGLRYSEHGLSRGKRARSSSRARAPPPRGGGAGAGAEVFGARRGARKARAIEQQDPRAAAREVPSGGGSGGARADDDRVPDHASSPAHTAPPSVAARFTASLSSQRTLPCSVAPSSESSSNPKPPAAVSVMKARFPTRYETPAMNAAPANPPSVPTSVIPPSVPAGTRLQVVISLGSVDERPPISVAQVSAFAVASAPANQVQLPDKAASAATPPLAMTCRAFRVVFLRDSALAEIKKARSGVTPRHPNPQIVAAPTAAAAAQPRPVSHFTRRTARAARASSARAARPASCSAPSGI